MSPFHGENTAGWRPRFSPVCHLKIVVPSPPSPGQKTAWEYRSYWRPANCGTADDGKNDQAKSAMATTISRKKSTRPQRRRSECSTAFLTAFASAGWSVPGRSRFVLERMASSPVTVNAVMVVRRPWGIGRGHCLDRRGSDNRRCSGRRRDRVNDGGRICGRGSRWDRSRRRGDGRRSGIGGWRSSRRGSVSRWRGRSVICKG
jgi:hypothetical protein